LLIIKERLSLNELIGVSIVYDYFSDLTFSTFLNATILEKFSGILNLFIKCLGILPSGSLFIDFNITDRLSFILTGSLFSSTSGSLFLLIIG
jgi:hypothetical protein